MSAFLRKNCRASVSDAGESAAFHRNVLQTGATKAANVDPAAQDRGNIFARKSSGLAAVGVYGVKAYSVARRTREIGIRMALGAEGKTVQWMILREGLAMVVAGLAIGLLLAFGTGKIVSSILFEVSSTDPFAFTLAPALLMIAALLATWLPARRATKISPMAALRTE
jgi:ABC-type antimicrobial peptide transport system permease subunit